jgi:hypothetical protein
LATSAFHLAYKESTGFYFAGEYVPYASENTYLNNISNGMVAKSRSNGVDARMVESSIHHAKGTTIVRFLFSLNVKGKPVNVRQTMLSHGRQDAFVVVLRGPANESGSLVESIIAPYTELQGWKSRHGDIREDFHLGSSWTVLESSPDRMICKKASADSELPDSLLITKLSYNDL